MTTSAQAGPPSVAHPAGIGSVADVLRGQAAMRGEQPFLVFEAADGHVDRVTYGSALQRASATAAVLRERGVAANDRVLVMLPNGIEFCDVWFATALLGAALVPVDPRSAPSEIAWILTDAHAEVCVVDAAAVKLVERAATLAARGVRLVVAGGGVTRHERLGSLVAAAKASDEPAHRAGPEDIAAVLYTSGTTSRPKGVTVSGRNYVHAGESVAAHLRIRPPDRWLVVLPLFHANAQYYCVMSALVTGASVALVGRFSASQWGRQCAELEATLASLFAAPIRMILAATPSELDSENNLRATLFAQNLTGQQAGAFESRFGTPLLQLYGMTETIAPATCNPLYGKRKPDSIGRALLGRRLRVVDERSREVPAGEVGELLVHGEPGRTLMAGYLNQPAETADVLREGWLHTGDLVRADGEGYLYFVDRAKDMIKRSGENVAAGEVERVADEHPAVLESAAVGVPDAVRDEAIVLHVVLHDGRSATGDELIAWCEQRLAPFKVPDSIRFLDQLPRTSVGKIRKSALRGQAHHGDTEGAAR